MTEKVKLPKDVCDALDLAKAKGFNSFEIIEKTYRETWHIKELKILNEQFSGDIMRALVLGYEPEMTADEHIKFIYFDKYHSYRGYIGTEEKNAYQEGIRDALRIHGIKYDWLEGDAE